MALQLLAFVIVVDVVGRRVVAETLISQIMLIIAHIRHSG